jgi:hypothetical protein
LCFMVPARAATRIARACHAPTPISALTVFGAVDVKANSCRTN